MPKLSGNMDVGPAQLSPSYLLGLGCATSCTWSPCGHTHPSAPVCTLSHSRVNIARLYLGRESIRQSVSLFPRERERGKDRAQQQVLCSEVSAGQRVSSSSETVLPGGRLAANQRPGQVKPKPTATRC